MGRDRSSDPNAGEDRANWRRLALSAGCSSTEAQEWAAIASQKLRYPADSHVLLEEIMVDLEEKAQSRQSIRLALVKHRTAGTAAAFG